MCGIWQTIRQGTIIYSSKFPMLFTLTARVEVLCSSAEVAGCRMPPAPRAINSEFKADDETIVCADALHQAVTDSYSFICGR